MKSRLSFIIDNKQLPTVLEVIQPLASEIRVEPASNGDQPRTRTVSRQGGIMPLLKQLFADKAAWKLEALQAEFKKAGFASTSVSPSLTKPKREGWVAETGKGEYLRQKPVTDWK